jgi:hypothetical protein
MVQLSQSMQDKPTVLDPFLSSLRQTSLYSGNSKNIDIMIPSESADLLRLSWVSQTRATLLDAQS